MSCAIERGSLVTVSDMTSPHDPHSLAKKAEAKTEGLLDGRTECKRAFVGIGGEPRGSEMRATTKVCHGSRLRTALIRSRRGEDARRERPQAATAQAVVYYYCIGLQTLRQS